ncbi:spore germination protein [Symbiobacterium terraclitae]|uniref:spore germination protein n=1 Tax=Symbiobacterium terraclitae TaxID=557451 RepID=UPI0035B5472F
MNIWERLRRLLDPSASMGDDTFILGDGGGSGAGRPPSAEMLADARMRTEALLTRLDRLVEAAPQGKDALEKVGDLSTSLDENLQKLKELFRAPPNKDLIDRTILIATDPPVRAVLLFIEGISDKTVINDNIMQPLMLLAHELRLEPGQGDDAVDRIERRLLAGHQVSRQYDRASIAESLLSGDTVVLVEGAAVALAVETKEPPVRSVGDPKTEQVIWGPHDAFNEAWRVNVALVRRRLKDPRLVTEILTVGEVSKTYVGMLYIDTIAPPALVAEVKRRVEAVKVDIVNGAGTLQQYIMDNPHSLLPSTLLTERPDRTAAYLSEGHVALFVDTSPTAIICPTTFWALLQTAEDYYLRWPFGSTLRYIRLGALVIALLLPSLYIVVVNYHPEMVPTPLMLFIAQSREPVPMPSVVELLAMDVVFELIREAGTRIPGVIGPTVGLVASLVLGQAAVEARIVSPVLILVVATTGLASFALPNYLMGWGIRLLRFLLLLLTTLFGFLGLAAGLYALVVHASAQRSFGVPYLAPLVGTTGPVKDAISTPPLYRQEERPPYLPLLNRRRQKEIVRQWDPQSPQTNSPEGG